jgi:hypothetical protein
MIKELLKCRVCGGKLFDVVNLGNICPSGFSKTIEEVEKAPLVLVQCESCGLVQLKHTLGLDSMYRQYWYRSGLNKSMLMDLKDIVKDIEKTIELKEDDIVVDIGCNDGSLFNFYSLRELYKIGYDPAENLMETACNIDLFINDYFPTRYAVQPYKAKVITSIAMFYDLPDPGEFVRSIVEVLDKDGIWVLQFTDLASMLELSAFDNICHEHLEYYRLWDIINLLNKFGLSVFKVSHNKVNGGSIRISVCFSGKRPVELSVYEYLRHETFVIGKTDKYSHGKFIAFNQLINFLGIETKNLLRSLKSNGKSVFVSGASTKGNTLLQVWGIDNNLIKYAAEVNKDKFGLYTVGSNIKIISEEEALSLNPDYFFVLPWHFKSTFINKYREYINKGGKLIFPLPDLLIVDKKYLVDKGL